VEVSKGYLSSWHSLPGYVKGNRSHQFVSSAGLRFYFDSSGQPRNVSDDSLVTNLEAFITSSFQWEHYFNITTTSIATAISSYKSGADGIMFEIVVDKQTNRKEKHYFWNTKDNKPVELRRRDTKNLFTIDELLSGTWYLCTDVY
jgi:hypothetical protein